MGKEKRNPNKISSKYFLHCSRYIYAHVRLRACNRMCPAISVERGVCGNHNAGLNIAMKVSQQRWMRSMSISPILACIHTLLLYETGSKSEEGDAKLSTTKCFFSVYFILFLHLPGGGEKKKKAIHIHFNKWLLGLSLVRPSLL